MANTDRKKKSYVLNKNGTFKCKINLDRHGPRPIMKICLFADPPLSVLIV
jgi:hypothetical protein